MGVEIFTRPVQVTDSMCLDGFSSGCSFVDLWIITHGHSAKKQGTAVVYVTHRDGADITAEAPAGFYTLSTSAVARDSVTGGWLKRNSPDQIPVILLGVLGVDARYQKCGLGKMLLHDAAVRAMGIADLLGAKALVVDPIDQAATNFYLHNGFRIIPGTSRMFAKL